MSAAERIDWELTAIFQERIQAAQDMIDDTPVGDPLMLIAAVATRDAIKIAAEAKMGWQKKAA